MIRSSIPIPDECLPAIHACSLAELESNIQVIPSERLPSAAFLASPSPEDKTRALRATLILWSVTRAAQVPRELQLEATLAMRPGKDSLICAGTGSGKTLSIILNSLLDGPKTKWIRIVISPLRRLQITQENDFNSRYGISTVTINENTPQNDDWWHKHLHNVKGKTAGAAQIIIVTAEQLFKTREGHFPRFALLIRNRDFQNRIQGIYVDEAHFIHSVGMPRYGNSAFRPAWGRLDELKALLPASISWQALSATFPMHILKTVESKILRPGYISIKSSSNRPNTMYATHQVVTGVEELANYNCFLTVPFNVDTQPRVLLFFDDESLACEVARYLDNRLPLDLRRKGIVRHYHSGMSDDYLQHVHSAFTDKVGLGSCRIMCATAGQSVGVDFPDVNIVCTVGLPGDIVETLQRGGRVGRREGDKGLFVIFYEPWARHVPLEDYTYGEINDPDRPRAALQRTSNKRDRAAHSSVQLIQSKTCIRKYFAEYLGDDSINGLSRLLGKEAADAPGATANLYSAEFCCDRHEEIFDLEDFLPSAVFTGHPPPAPVKRKRAKGYRPLKERVALDYRLVHWLTGACESNDQHGITAAYDILSDDQRMKLGRALPNTLRTLEDIADLLEESEEWKNEWAAALLKVVMDYDYEITKRKAKQALERKGAKKALTLAKKKGRVGNK